MYTVTTNQGDSYTFDITTGQIICSSSLWNKALAAFFVAVPLIVYFLIRRNPELSKPSQSLKRFSLRWLLVLMTVGCVWLWLATVNWPLAIAIIVAPLIGGGIARIWSRRPRAWLTGTLLAIYGFVGGLCLWTIFIEPLMWQSNRGQPFMTLLLLLAIVGLVGGAILGGVLERRAVAFTKQTAAQLP